MDARILSVEVSWRREPGIDRAYAWRTDGTVLGYRDLTTGLDHVERPSDADVVRVVVEEWLGEYGVPCGPPPPPPAEPRGPWRGLRRRRIRRRAEQARVAHALDHPVWRVPIDPPHGGWHDLVRRRPGQGLWDHAFEVPDAGSSSPLGRSRRRSWVIGAEGEEEVGAILWRIARPGAWRVLHSVPVGSRGTDIDHVLIGPGGVFTLNTKHHRGARIHLGARGLHIEGRPHGYLESSRHEAERAAALLGRALGTRVGVHPLLVCVAPRTITVDAAAPGVTVLSDRDLPRWIGALPPVLSDTEVERLFAVARRSTTWRTV